MHPMHPAPSLVESFPKAPKHEDRHHSHHRHESQQPSPPSRPPSAVQHSDNSSNTMSHFDLRRSQSPGYPSKPLPPRPIRKDTGGSMCSITSIDTITTDLDYDPLPVRKDTNSSIDTLATDASNASTETSATNYSVESSQSIFSIKDGSEISNSRRASRRRTGPLSAQQREKAALIRKLGACIDCRRRRVACHPNHHNLTWEDAMRKYRSSSPLQDLAPMSGRQPASPHQNPDANGHSYGGRDEMDIDSTPPLSSSHGQGTPVRGSLSDSRIRTPLPTGPRMDRVLSAPSPAAPTPVLANSPNIDAVKAELEGTASRLLSSPNRNRYTAVSVLLVHWQDDNDPDIISAVEELGEVFKGPYNYQTETIKIPSTSTDGCTNSWRWLSRVINDFTENNDTRDVMKLVYYNGHSFLDENREMVLASSRDREKACTIRWSGIQQILEEAISDTLIIMDAAYYPSSKMVRQKGVLELVAASASEEHSDVLDRSSFTRALAEQLRTRATQQRQPNASANAANSPLSAAELHSKLLSLYPKIIRDRHPEKETVTSFPSPLHMQMAGSAKLPSIALAPIHTPRPTLWTPRAPAGPQLNLSIQLADESLNVESWTDWLLLMPEGIKDLKIEGPYTSTLRS